MKQVLLTLLSWFTAVELISTFNNVNISTYGHVVWWRNIDRDFFFLSQHILV